MNTHEYLSTELQTHLNAIGACSDARKWAGERTARQAWDESPRADWLIWWASACNVLHVTLVHCTCVCARMALKYVPAGEDRPRLAIEAAERWAKNPTEKNRRVVMAARSKAEEAAWTAIVAAWPAAAARAAWAAAEAVDAPNAAVVAVWETAGAAGAVVDAAAREAAEEVAQLKMCAIVRTIIPFEDLHL